MEEMDYVLDREIDIEPAEFDLLAYTIFSAPAESTSEADISADDLLIPEQPETTTEPLHRSIYTHDLVPMTDNELHLVVHVFGPNPENWSEYAVYDAMKEYLRSLSDVEA